MKNKNRAVELTMSLPGIPPRRGRPPTGNAMSAAQRQKIYRKNQLSDAKFAKQEEIWQFKSEVKDTPDETT